MLSNLMQAATLALLVIGDVHLRRGWNFDQGIDAITDQQGALAGIPSADGKAILALQCDHKTEGRPMFFQLRPGVGRHFSGWFEVTMRVDRQEPFSYRWYWAGAAGLVADPGQVKRIARALVGGDRLLVRALDYNDQPVDMEFEVAKPSEVFARVFLACGQPDFLGKR